MSSITSKWAKNLRYKKILYKHSQILPPDDAKQGLQKLDGFFFSEVFDVGKFWHEKSKLLIKMLL